MVLGLRGRACVAIASALWLGSPDTAAAACSVSYECSGTDVCKGGECVATHDCRTSGIKAVGDEIQIRGWQCRVTLEAIYQAMPDAVSKEGTEYTLNKQIVIRDGCVLEIHGPARASSPDAAVSLLKLKVRIITCCVATGCNGPTDLVYVAQIVSSRCTSTELRDSLQNAPTIFGIILYDYTAIIPLYCRMPRSFCPSPRKSFRKTPGAYDLYRSCTYFMVAARRFEH